MIRYTIKMQHDEKTFEALSRMQYDLFCSSNRDHTDDPEHSAHRRRDREFHPVVGHPAGRLRLLSDNQHLQLREPHGTQACGTDQKIAGCRFRHPAMNSLMIILKFMFFLPVKKKFP